MFFFLNTLRTAFVILLYVLFSYLVNRHHRANKTTPKISTIGNVPRGKHDQETNLLYIAHIYQVSSMLACHTSPRTSFRLSRLSCHRP
jgi:hypothetical protein